MSNIWAKEIAKRGEAWNLFGLIVAFHCIWEGGFLQISVHTFVFESRLGYYGSTISYK